MEALLASTFTVAIAEIGDKTQLLALILAARFKNKTAIILGILLSTLFNHFAAAWIGQWAINWVSPDLARYLVAASFFAIALWVLIPDKVDAEESRFYKMGPFLATFILFFIAEMGDKTQIATVVLAAKYDSLTMVVAGTTLGMLLANVPVVIAGHFSAEKLPMLWIHRGCAVLFALLGVATLFF
ncbi:TMEM165/GDT1 family protein [Shewanella sp. NKUCC05_KAH]|uniref:GDT1 family protein n=1 Tax=Shewanella oncorhynchi TaxID=2726434 RepID=A0AA50Q5U4_9GAMM|nr:MULTISPECIES: TMEM165/GDT1 family protein [Shewanella]MBI1675110.1 TMEM165/GDT1 family protein [Shewanella sp. DW31]MBP6519976.1 TMEM165/GDT1 family protein [Shewanella sp.]MBS0042823.1 TMEM165/GDT1 family protein [Shewanella sp. M16]MBW3515039.1 TMEM165/GDT1 family protein [Shewanella sp. NKUCC01_JLK]MBW3529251.1 TMEM165/GDT1 family protein [Shewanella sp. NKUCC05_KAH]